MSLHCNDPKDVGCRWSGTVDELVCLTDSLDDQDFWYCPQCEGKDFDEEDEEES